MTLKEYGTCDSAVVDFTEPWVMSQQYQDLDIGLGRDVILIPDRNVYCDDVTVYDDRKNEAIVSLEPNVVVLIRCFIFIVVLMCTQISIAWSILWLKVASDRCRVQLSKCREQNVTIKSGREQNVTVQSGYEADSESNHQSDEDDDQSLDDSGHSYVSDNGCQGVNDIYLNSYSDSCCTDENDVNSRDAFTSDTLESGGNINACQVTDNYYSDLSPSLPLGVDRVCYGYRGDSYGVTQGGGTRVTRSLLRRESLFSCIETEEDTETLSLEEGVIKEESVCAFQSGITLPSRENNASELNLGGDASQ